MNIAAEIHDGNAGLWCSHACPEAVPGLSNKSGE